MILCTAYIQVLAMFYGQATYSELWVIMWFFVLPPVLLWLSVHFKGKNEYIISINEI